MIAMANLAATGPDQMSRKEFRDWTEAQTSGRFERHDGWVVAMAPERAAHADRKALAWLALRRAVTAAGLPCHVYPDGMTVEVDDSDYEPDAILRCGEPLSPNAVSVPDPMVIVEVLSPSTRSIDLTRKLVEYFRLPSVQHYLIFWSDKAQVVHHRRRGGGVDTNIITAGKIELDPPGITVTVEEVCSE
jgi:Uma2 family endonuclease